ncbi:hypothetical protein Tsp_13702, partial [Trichinella spiralis]|uniref:hypothetical protein n=1 Tax=Trichinella spiralis TaxID=6334 RepID=UPI0001EFD636
MLFSIQKYAGSPTLGFQSIGVVAALSALKVAFEYGGQRKTNNLHNSKQVDNITSNSSIQFCKLDETLFNQLLDFICNTTKNSYFLSALVFDELSNIVENTDDQCSLNLQSFERNASDTLAKFICAPNDCNRLSNRPCETVERAKLCNPGYRFAGENSAHVVPLVERAARNFEYSLRPEFNNRVGTDGNLHSTWRVGRRRNGIIPNALL